jgi:Sulfotransferase domain
LIWIVNSKLGAKCVKVAHLHHPAFAGQPQLMTDTSRIVLRHIVLFFCLPLPPQNRKTIERWLRGREEFMRLQRADWVLISFGNSGRTWLRVMLSRFHQLKYGLNEHELLDFDNLKKRNSEIPAVLFSHNNYLRDYTGGEGNGELYSGKKIVLLVRDPRDTAVSQFFQWRYRMRPNKKFINNYPAHGTQISTWDFLLDQDSGVPRIVDYCNDWVPVIRQPQDILLVRYEDMRDDPHAVLSRILNFTGTPGTEEQVRDAVEFASYENMKKMEASKFFSGLGSRLRQRNTDNPQSFKVRKAKVGGYRDLFTDEQCDILAKMTAKLDPVFGYGNKKA